MSNYQTRDNSGALFRNEEKRSDNGPDYSGSCVIDGVDHFFDAWLKTADSGRKWMSFSFKKKDKQSATQPQRTPAPRPAGKTHGDRPGGPNNRPQFDSSADDIPS